MENEILTGLIGTGVSAIGTATQTNETLQTISLVITILGAVVSMVVIPLINWYKNAKKDGKIDKKEINDGINILQEGSDAVKKVIDENKDRKEK